MDDMDILPKEFQILKLVWYIVVTNVAICTYAKPSTNIIDLA